MEYQIGSPRANESQHTELQASSILHQLLPICTSTNCAVQHKFIIKRLEEAPRTTIDFRDMGVFACAVRIKELREAGYNIQTNRVIVIDAAEVKHNRVALYSLHLSVKKERLND